MIFRSVPVLQPLQNKQQRGCSSLGLRFWPWAPGSVSVRVVKLAGHTGGGSALFYCAACTVRLNVKKKQVEHKAMSIRLRPCLLLFFFLHI